MKILPTGNGVLIKRADPATTTPGGIIIPDMSQEKATEAIVLGVGPGKVLGNGRRVEPNVKIGDRVILSKWSGAELEIDGKDYLIVSEDEIMVVYE